MNLKIKHYYKRFICFSLATGLTLLNSVTAFAAETTKIDYDLLADLISERQYLDNEYSKIGLSIDEILELPQMDSDFYNRAKVLAEDVLPEPISTYIDEPTVQSLEAQRFAYAGKMAQWSVAQKPGRNEEQEVVYMYLSHYVDVPRPLSPDNGISNNSNDGVLAKYICQYDRDTYDLYLSKGASLQAARDIKNLISFGYSTPSTAKDALTWMKGHKTVVNTFINGGNVGLTALSGKQAFEVIKTEMQGGKTPEQIIEAVRISLDPTYGELSKSMAQEFAGLVFSVASQSVTPIGVGLSAASVTIDLSTNLLERVNFISMRLYFSFRWNDRFNYYMYGSIK